MKPGLVATFLLVTAVIPSAAQRGMRSAAPARSFARLSANFARPVGVHPVPRGAPRFRPFGAGTSFQGRGVIMFALGNHRAFVHRPFFPRHRLFLATFPFGSPLLLGGPIYPYLTEYPAVSTSDTGAYQ